MDPLAIHRRIARLLRPGPATPVESGSTDTRFRLGRGLALALLCLVLGFALRIREYGRGAPFWYDESYLLLNVAKVPFAGACGPFDHALVSPPFFVWVVRACFLAFGMTEWGTRLPAFLAGLATLAAVAFVSRRLVAGPFWWLPVALAALSRHAISHGVEVHPYTVDQLLATLVLGCAVAIIHDGPRRRLATVGLILLAAFAPWFSFPSPFALAGAVGALFVAACREGTRTAWWRFLAIASVSAVSGLALWFIQARHMYYPGMNDHWGPAGWGGFPDFARPSSVALWPITRLIQVGNYGTREMGILLAIFVRELVRPTYACRSCESAGHDPQIAKAALPPEPIPKSGVGAGLLAHVIVSKFVDHLPLHRQESILARHGWDARRSTLCDHLRKCGQLLTPLYDEMRRRLLRSFAIHADDTPLLLLRPRRTAFAWVYLGDADNPYTLFDLTAGRSQTFPQAFLDGYRGFVHADAYDGYNAVHDDVRHLGCWMHARRYFVEAEPNDPQAVEALAFIRTLYAVEREIQDEREKLGDRFADADAARWRRTRAGPILARFSDWLEAQHRGATPKSLFGQAVTYARNQWSSLVRYLDDARFAIDNGAAERAIRPLAVGRANWLHVGGDGGLKTASVLLSVCASATRHRLNPWSYLRNVLDQIARRTASVEVGDLLPETWAICNAQTN